MKKCLCVGINKYGNGNDLQGCIQDVYTMTEIVENHFDFKLVQTLLDEQATTANILDKLKWLVDGAKAGDVLMFVYSGHGSQIKCDDGSEEDNLSEIICPVDLDWDTKIITDKMLAKIFSTLPEGAILYVHSDSCHSQDLLRDIQPVKSKCLINPNLKARNGIKNRSKIKRLIDYREQKGILYSGCQDHQTSADAFINNQHCGAFTWALSTTLQDNDYKIDNFSLIGLTRQKLQRAGYEQIPCLDCSRKYFKTPYMS